MRVIFTCWAWPTHFYAMVPLARAFRDSGHEVVVAIQPGAGDAVASAGLDVVHIGAEVDALATFRNIALGPPSAHGRPPANGRGGRGPRVLTLLTAIAETMVPDLITLTRDWRADLIVFDPTAFAGPLAAAVTGVTAVRQLYGLDLLGGVGQFVSRALAPLSRQLRLTQVDLYGAVTVDPCPAALQLTTSHRRLPIRYEPYAGPAVTGSSRPEPSSRLSICISWGTTLSRLASELFLAGRVAWAASDLGADVVVAITAGQRPLLGPLPPGVRVFESTPLNSLLPGCDAVVAHGGAGTSLTAIAHGLPQLLIPRLPDHTRMATRVAEVGAGLVLAAAEADAAAIRYQLGRLLATPAYRATAARLGREMARSPRPGVVIPQIEDLLLGRARPV